MLIIQLDVRKDLNFLELRNVANILEKTGIVACDVSFMGNGLRD